MSSTLGFSFRAIRSLVGVKPKRQLKEMYIFLLLFSFAAALVTIFEPVFFYQQGIALWQIALYYAVHYTLYVFLMPLGGMFAARFGYERALTLSTPLFVLYFLALAWLPQMPALLWVAVIILTIFKTLYWPAYHANFADFTDQRNRGTEQSWVQLIQYGAGIAGPLFGGIVATYLGFPVLFLITAATVALAGVSLLRTREDYHLSRFDYWAPWRIIRARRHRRMVVSMIGWGENLVYLAFWPVFMFIVLKNVEVLGIVASLSAAVATVLGFLVGELTDRISPRRTLSLMVPVVMASYIWRLFSFAPWQILIGDIWARGSVVSISIPFVARLYKEGKQAGALEYAVAFEIVLAIAKAALAFVLAYVFLVTAPAVGFSIAFTIAAILAVFYAVL